MNYFLDPETRKNLRQGGYIKDVDDIIAPSVYPLNMAISSFVLFEFLNLYTGFKPPYWYVYLDYLDMNSTKRKSLNTRDDKEGSAGLCFNCELYKAKGDAESLSYFTEYEREVILPE